MAPKRTSFEDRLARIQADASRPPAPVVPAQERADRPALTRSLRMQLASTGVGLALMAGMLAYVWDDISILFPKPVDGRKVSYLEQSLRDSMTDEEIRKMNEDPRLDGMTQMQKMIMSH
ncbi:MAG: hypothetical protein AAFO97_02700 [Pseudomonadota bacterium]